MGSFLFREWPIHNSVQKRGEFIQEGSYSIGDLIEVLQQDSVVIIYSDFVLKKLKKRKNIDFQVNSKKYDWKI